MPRPMKCRKVCHFPKALEFSPVDVSAASEPVILAVDEYETIRLIDKEGMSQEQCAAFMQIARTTVQRIYDTARKKLAICVVDGRPLRIEGGDFKLCNGRDIGCGYNSCYKQQYHEQYKTEKGEHIMRIAVTYENGQIFQHFGHTEQFKVYDVQDGKIVDSQIVDTNGSGHGALAGILTALNVDALICGGIGGGAQTALAAANIQLYGGVSGSTDEAVAALIAGQLAYDPDAKCDHHDHQHGEGHTCGEHGCGEHH
ncbi:MAG: NifB/NifX family molybdenum-iron cluster-binding protein [Muricoprocola sp.]